MPEFDTRAAATLIREAGAIDGALRQRMEGLTTAIWGLALPAMFLTYGLIHAEVGHEGSRWLGLLWLPWGLAGLAVTTTAWRGARLSDPAVPPRARDRWMQAGGFVVAYGLAVWLAFRFADRVGPESFAMLAVGALWTILAVVDLRRSSPTGRWLRIAVGVALFATGLVMAQALAPDSMAAAPVGTAASAIAPLAAGLYQAWRA